MKIAVFGAAGFVGQHVVADLRENGIEVVASDIHGILGQEIEFADIATGRQKVRKIVEDCDAVVHLAAAPLGHSLDYPMSNAFTNIIGMLNLLEVMRDKSVNKIIFSSASSLYGDVPQNGGNSYIVRSVPETTPCIPKTPYGVAKLACEHYLRVFHELYGVEYLVFRFFNVYGPGQRGGLIPAAYRAFARGEQFTIQGDGKQVRDFVYVKDVARFIRKALERDGCWNEVYNLGSGVPYKIIDAVRDVAQVMQVTPQIKYDKAASGEIANYVASMRKLRAVFGETPKPLLESYLRETIEWLKQNEK